MSEIAELSLEEALAVHFAYSKLGHPNRAQSHLVSTAREIIEARAAEAAQRFTKGLCTTCWGDGWNRISDSMLRGPCEACNGSGRLKSKQSQEMEK